MHKTFAGLAATAAALTLGIAAPATADGIGVKDPADVHHGVDLRTVTVDNSAKGVRIVLNHTNLRADHRAGASGSVYLDTDAQDPGPELVFTGGYHEGTDYQLLATEGFGVRKWGAPVRGFYLLRPDYAKDQTRMRISRRALGQADDTQGIRVAVKVAGYGSDGSTVTDWLGKRFSFTPWVSRG